MMNLDQLPEDCFAHILSLTSPQDACRSSLASSCVRAMADSDSLWDHFLPSDYKEILSRLVFPVVYSSNKELFFRLCSPCLIDGGKKIFWIEKSTNKKCIMLSARELSITWASHPLYWTWKPIPESRFAEVAELITMWWLEICGSVNTKMLSPNTLYTAYLVVKFADRAYGLDFLPSEVSVEVGNSKALGKVNLNPQEGRSKHFHRVRFLNQLEALRSRLLQDQERGGLGERENGWIKIELGSFFNDGSGEELKISLREVKGQHLRGGLIVEGIEIRPKH
ncbi:F-box protein PP2-B15-like [Humulus lupulus]|uniref:F-box protein PP2-B15-like n=1 Tax=Humulus lupulus TaxID=3486 RepID=UPI002B40BAAE|nr:F-box protein PP2-B15-like [Humulus lupulus]